MTKHKLISIKHSQSKVIENKVEAVEFLDERKEALIAKALCILIPLLYMLWAMLSNATWDDDCPTRYFNVLQAFSKPETFVNLWNRPLFVILFAIPAHLGKISIPLVMSTIAGFTGYYLFLNVKMMKIKYALVVIPFLLMQPFYFGVGRDAMTEPLAASLIVFGLYALLQQKWLLFAILGALIPLARVELIPLLGIWGLILLLKGQWKFIPVLALGVVLWNIAGWIITGDAIFFASETILKKSQDNIYGHQTIGTYFSRYLYVIGPVVFFYFIIGLIKKAKDLAFDWFILAQFLVGFFLYTYVAVKMDLGASAGFLRNLIPLSPLAAIIALVGFEYWLDGLTFSKSKILVLISVFLATAIIIIFFRYDIRSHHKIGEELSMLNAPIGIGLMLLTFIGLFLSYDREVVQKKFQFFSMGFISILVLAQAMISEPPNKNLNPERVMINDVTAMLKKSKLIRDAPLVYCNHPWLFWAGGYNRFDKKFKSMFKSEIATALPGSIIVWEDHFSNRLGADVQLADLTNDPTLIPFGNYKATDFGINTVCFYKKKGTVTSDQIVNHVLKSSPNSKGIVYQQYLNHSLKQDTSSASKVMTRLISLDKKDPVLKYYYINYLTERLQTDKALEEIALLDKMDRGLDFISSLRGSVYFYTKDYKKAINEYNEHLKKDSKSGQTYFNIAACYLNLGDKVKGCEYLIIAKKKGMVGVDDVYNQNCNSTSPVGQK
jgi:hypothetical protein